MRLVATGMERRLNAAAAENRKRRAEIDFILLKFCVYVYWKAISVQSHEFMWQTKIAKRAQGYLIVCNSTQLYRLIYRNSDDVISTSKIRNYVPSCDIFRYFSVIYSTGFPETSNHMKRSPNGLWVISGEFLLCEREQVSTVLREHLVLGINRLDLSAILDTCYIRNGKRTVTNKSIENEWHHSFATSFCTDYISMNHERRFLA
jgi:hypothetical protein